NNTSSTVATTVNCPPEADLSVSKTGPASVLRGGTVSYIIETNNNGPDTAQNVVVADQIPSGLTFNSGASSAGCVKQGGSILCNNFDLNDGNSRTFTVAFDVSSYYTCGGTIDNEATVSASTTDPNSSNNTSSTVSTTVDCPPPEADLEITIIGPATVMRGGSINYVLTASNNGPNTAQSVVVTDSIPSGLTFNSGASSVGCSQQGGNIVCDNFDLNNGSSRMFIVEFTVSPTYTCGGTINNETVITSSTIDPVSSNNTSSTVATTVNCPPEADLSVRKTGPANIMQGGTISYTLEAINHGPDTATNIVVADVIPSGLTFNSGSSSNNCIQQGGSILCNNFDLNNGSSRSFTVAFDVSSSYTCGGTIYNEATVSTSITDPDSSNNTSSTVSTTVDCPTPEADLFVTKVGPSTVLQGTSISYTITSTNNGPDSAQGVIVTDTIPSGLTFNSGASSFDCSQQGGNIVCNNFNLSNGASRQFVVTFDVSASYTCGGTIQNQASVSTSTIDPVSGNNTSSTVATTVDCLPEADLSISKTCPANVMQGNTVSYTLETTNHGPNTATNVVVADVIPAGLTFNSGASSVNCIQQGGSILCNNFSLTNGSSRSFTVVFNVSPTYTCGGSIQNTATVSTSTTDPNSSNNKSLTVSTTVNCPIPEADLSVSKTGNSVVTQGGTISYSLTATNHGPNPAQNVVVADQIPAGLTFNSGASSVNCIQQGGSILCNNFSLNNGASRNFTVAFDVSPSYTCGGTILNRATVSTSVTDPVSSNNTSQTISTIVNCPIPQADLSIVKSGVNNIQIGSILLYTLTTTNQGPNTGNNIVIRDVIPAGLAFNAAVSDSDCIANAGEVLCNNLNLTSGQSKTYIIAFDVPQSYTCGGTIQNVATVSTSSTDPITANNTSQTINTTVNCPVPEADLSVIKSGSSNVEQGNTFTYTLTAINHGPNTAQNVVVADVIPAGLTFNAAQSDSACIVQGNSVLCNNLSLSNGASKYYNVSFDVSPSYTCGGTILNNATVSTSTTDPNSNNNTSQTIQTTVQCLPTDNADLSVAKTGSPTANQGGVVHYTLTATNHGPDTAQNVVVADVIPSGLTFNAAQSDPACIQQGNSVLCNNFSLSNGSSRAFTVAFDVSPTYTCGGVILNRATVSTSTTDHNSNNNTSQTIQTKVQCQPTDDADLSVTKTGPSAVMRDSTVSYTLTAINHGPNTANNVVVADVIPAGLTFNAAQSDPSCIQQGNSILCNNLTLANGSSRAYIVTFDIDPLYTCGGGILNQATVSTSSTDNNPSNNRSLVTHTIVQCQTVDQADLSVTKIGPATAQYNNFITYALSVTNQGPNTADNVSVRDVIPAGMTFMPALSDSRCSLIVTNTVECIIPSLASSSSDIINVIVKVEPTASCNIPLTNQGIVASDTLDPNNVNNASNVSTTVQCAQPNQSDLSIAKSGPTTAARGSILTYGIVIINHGPDDAQNVVITDSIPTGLTFNTQVSSSFCTQQGNDILCTRPTVASNISEGFNIAFDIPTTTTCDSILNNQATVSASTTDPVLTNNTSQTVQTTVSCGGTPTFSITKTDNVTTTQPGATLTYSIVVTNTSTVDATNVSVTDSLPTNTTYITSSDSGVNNSGVVSWSGLNLNAGLAKTLTVNVRVNDNVTNGTVITNSAFVNGQQAQDNTTVQSSTGSTNQLTLTLDDTVDPVEPCENYNYTLRVTNVTTNAINNVTTTLSLDNDTTYLASSNNGTHSNGIVTWPDFTAAASNTETRTVTVKANCNTQDNDILRAQAFAEGLTDSEDTRVDEGGGTDDNGITLNITDDTPDPVEIGEVLTYNIRVCNEDNTSTTTDVTAFLDSDTSYLSSSDNGRDINDDEVKWDDLDLNANGCETLALRVRVMTSAREGSTLRLEARAEDDSDTENTRVVDPGGPIPPIPPLPPGPGGAVNLSVDKTADRREVQPGSVATYTITIRNTSNDTANAIMVEDSFTAGSFTIDDPAGGIVSGNTIRWTVASLAPNASRVLRYRVRISPSMLHGQTISNTVTIDSPDLIGPRSDTEQVRVMSQLPQTGLGGFISDSNSVDQYIRPHARTSSSSDPISSLPFVIWLNIIAMGLSGGLMTGKKLFLFT
ncbi:DUF11 domain-containing protein, partial [Patescibacteria group bacterium]|nr:DUF11 domain-containing protein [Patescibacteria group bacterium]